MVWSAPLGQYHSHIACTMVLDRTPWSHSSCGALHLQVTKTHKEGTDDNLIKLLPHSNYGMFCAEFLPFDLAEARHSFEYVRASSPSLRCPSLPLSFALPLSFHGCLHPCAQAKQEFEERMQVAYAASSGQMTVAVIEYTFFMHLTQRQKAIECYLNALRCDARA